MKGLFSAAIAILVGVVVLVGYFIQNPVLDTVRSYLLQWSILLAGVAVLVGVFNLLFVHASKLRDRKSSLYSLILIVAMLFTFLLGLVFGPANPTVSLLFNSVQLPIEASLMALLAFSLVFATVRLLQRRLDLLSVIFIGTAFIIFLGTAPLPTGYLPLVSDTLRPIIAQLLAAGGARGILLGVALGTLMTGLRILFGADRPYGGK